MKLSEDEKFTSSFQAPLQGMGAAFINLENDLPGIRGPMAYSPETGKALNEIAEILLHDDNNTLSRGDREMIGAYVSSQNDCFFCQNVHGAMAQHYYQCDMPFIDDIKKDYQTAPISDKLKALLSIAGSVQKGWQVCYIRTNRTRQKSWQH